MDSQNPQPTDGRHARGERSKRAVASALYDLLAEGILQPSVDEVAERAGVSRRVIFNHFKAMEEVYALVVTMHAGELSTHLKPSKNGGSFATRLSAFVTGRAELFEFITPIRRAALLLEPRSEVIAGSLAAMRAFLRDDTYGAFAQELAALPKKERLARQHALGAVTAWSFWWSLRSEQGLSETAARAAVRANIASLLEP